MTQVYQDTPAKDISSKSWERIFLEAVDASDLIWHRDAHNRQVTVLEGTGWRLQVDNHLPFDLEPGQTVTIPAGVYHRLLKGPSVLRLRIVESGSTHQE